jgi:DNA-binding helix-hairpin-helix protein with protein kinase domain
LESWTEKMDTVVAELVNFFQALKSGDPFGYLILLALVLIGLALIIVAVAYQRIVIKRFQTASKATQENFETIAADLRKRALEVKRQDEGLRKRDLEVKERDELKGFVEDANAELRCEPKRLQQQRQVLKGSQRAMKASVSHIITVGLKDIQNRMLQTDLKVVTSVVADSSKADLDAAGAQRIHDVYHETSRLTGPSAAG